MIKQSPSEIAELIAPYVTMSKEDIVKSLQEDTAFVWIDRMMEPEKSKAVAKLIEDKNLEGLNFVEESKRYYPNGNLATRGVTRAWVSMEKAAQLKKPCIFAIGNAPTALVSLDALMAAELLRPALLIGVPVGFVNVVESKELIIEGGRAPYIVARGRKGGSNVAAAICNALLYQIRR